MPILCAQSSITMYLLLPYISDLPFTSDFRIKESILTENIDKTISKAKCDNIIICGDLNMPKIKWNSMTESTTSEYPLFLEMLTENGYEQIITSPTHQSGTILDCVLINYGSTNFTIDEKSFSDQNFLSSTFQEHTLHANLHLSLYYPLNQITQ